MNPPVRSDEPARLAALLRYAVLDTPPEQSFDDLTSLAALVCGTPFAAITLVDERRQWFKSILGLSVSETPREISLCAHTIHEDQGLLVIPDTLEDARFCDNPLVTGGPRLRFYAGASLVTPGGLPVGTLCVVDTVPRQLLPAQTEALKALSRQVVAQLELRTRLRLRSEALVATQQAEEQAVEALRKSEERHRTMIETATDGVLTMDGESRILYANPATSRIFGYSAAELVGQKLTLLMPLEHRAQHEEGMSRYQETGLKRLNWQSVEFPGLHRDGSEVPLEISFSESVSGGIRTFTGIVRDVTERKRAALLKSALYRVAETASREENLPKFYAALHRIVGTLMDARNFYIALHDPRTERLTFPYFVDELDTNPGSLPVGRGVTDYVLRTGEPLLLDRERFERLVRAGEVELVGAPSVDWLGVPLKSQSRTFGVLVVQSYSESIRFHEEHKDILTFVSRHIAGALERKRSQEALKEWKERYEAAILASGQILYDWQPREDIETYGGNVEKILGYRVEEIAPASSGWRGLIHPEDRGGFEAEVERVLAAKEPFHREYRVRRKDGTHLFVRDDGYFILDNGGEPVRMVGFVVDITERKSLEEQLRHAQRMEAVGRLAGGIAHDFNNVLMAILGYSDLLLPLVNEAEAVQNVLEIKKAGERAAGLTRQLLALSRKQMLSPRVIDLNALVTNMEKMLRRVIGEDVGLVSRLSPGAALIKADPAQIEHVIMNLVVNARDAMPGGGGLLIETAPLPAGAWAVRAPTGSPRGPQVVLTVTDTGSGMSAETRARLFEPFFTTKDPGKGTGLGLATSYGIVKQSGGEIEVESVPERGTTVRIYFPLAAEGIEEPQKPGERRLRTRGNETILVVEDEPSVGLLAKRVLEQHGYRVLRALSAEEALGVAQRQAEPIHLLLTDVVMPGLSGRELAQVLLRSRPGMRVIYMSGHTDDAVLRHGVLEEGTVFLQKPFELDILLDRVRDVLDSR